MVSAAIHIKAIMFGGMLTLIYLYSTFQVVYKTIKFFKELGVEKRDRSLLRLAEIAINGFILTTITLGLMYDGERVIGLGHMTLISGLVLAIYFTLGLMEKD